MSNETEKELLFRVIDDISSVKEKMHSIDKTLIKQNVDLELHMKRSQAAEDRLDLFEGEIKPAIEAYKNVESYGKFAFGAFKLVCKIVAGSAPFIYYYFKYISHS